MKISKQMKLTLLGYVILLISIFIPYQDTNKKLLSYNLEKRIQTFILMLIPISVSLYSINCMVIGKCELWAWYNSFIIFIWSSIVFLIGLCSKMNLKID